MLRTASDWNRHSTAPQSTTVRPDGEVNCSICQGDSRVLRKEGAERRRECLRCKHRWTTVEQQKERVAVIERAIEKAREIGAILTGVEP